MVPSFHGSNDFVWICDPGKGFGVFVGFGDEAIDGGLEIDERVEDAAFEPPSCEFGEEALDGVEPGGGWREVEDKSLVAIEPSPDLWLLMDGWTCPALVERHSLCCNHPGLECYRRFIAERGMSSAGIVEAIDVLANGYFGLPPRLETGAPDQF